MILANIINFNYFVVLVFLFLFSCAHLKDNQGVRNNPYDPGGVEWIQYSAPVVMMSTDSLWEDFNHTCTTGSKRLYLQVDDLNFPYDTLFGSIYCNGKKVEVSAFNRKFDTTFILSQIKPNSSPVCTVMIFDCTEMVTTGTSRSTDTLIGRKYSSSVTTPIVSSVSKGSYLTHITLSINGSSYSNIDHFEILRSENDTNSFRFVGSVKSSGSSTVYYNGSVKTSANCYYRVTAINKQGLCNFPSILQYGFLCRLPPPDVTFTSYAGPQNSSQPDGFKIYRSTKY